MTQFTSIATGKRYTTAQVCRVWRIGSSTVYDYRARRKAVRPPARRRGPTGPCSDEELVERMRGVLAQSPFLGEGYRKVWARLRMSGTRTSKERVRRLMRLHGLSAPHHPKRARGSKAHDRSITTAKPDQMWGTDATSVLTGVGTATIFFVVDHCTAECLGIHAARRGTRLEALEPVRQAVRRTRGHFDADVASGTAMRHDHGSQYMSRDFQDELRFLGIKSSPAFVAEPECNGVAERFVKTLKEQLLWVERFETVEELLVALHAFRERYNVGWLVQKHDYRTPAASRAWLQVRHQEAA